ncbi:hypothetical protein RRF57_011045 [Xylaria bambusicola]|uniref:Uncharacterized protein n=1 Tax=Xylaria bambusicola TaxID=326684 RepID=A0AAN7ZDM1_9PEZI
MDGVKKYSPPREITHLAPKSNSVFDPEMSRLVPTICRGFISVATPIIGSMPGSGTGGTAVFFGGKVRVFAQPRRINVLVPRRDASRKLGLLRLALLTLLHEVESIA